MNLIPSLLLLTLFFSSSLGAHENVVTCGSSLKLHHQSTGYKLHSHDVNYGSGSHQQSVTASPNADDVNSFFSVQVVNTTGGTVCYRGFFPSCLLNHTNRLPIACDAHVYFKHVTTGKFLHSHLHLAPLSGNQEVSCFDGSNDDNHWKVVCQHNYWIRDKDVSFQHTTTKKWLSASKKFTYGNPIPGQLEVSSVPKFSKETVWQAQQGIYIYENE